MVTPNPDKPAEYQILPKEVEGDKSRLTGLEILGFGFLLARLLDLFKLTIIFASGGERVHGGAAVRRGAQLGRRCHDRPPRPAEEVSTPPPPPFILPPLLLLHSCQSAPF